VEFKGKNLGVQLRKMDPGVMFFWQKNERQRRGVLVAILQRGTRGRRKREGFVKSTFTAVMDAKWDSFH
jgi:hypothetical protein